ncbi:MAG: hypothetical protein WAM14_17985 [Candidatus Nitrosopolaris sp.]
MARAIASCKYPDAYLGAEITKKTMESEEVKKSKTKKKGKKE